ncbi:MAG: hypothetical protein KKE02_02495 [Alphaproteobacteria bacterium]|nr:hypothetical protein [Alphaproteobacteria bacterium]MBU1513453.1 hypothetical protein [Alphaproteobacteria bacterium]MBU2096445.1 hypothetical protein [Alphaproteobacteria bacterium]MBU2149863.1 hypothetical protein [Alphaproteobacteria bacterium]MBU2308231.1 hypothetical protein [Alphaproteobacteria bacterium]
MKTVLIALFTLCAGAAQAQTAEALMKAPLRATASGVAIDMTRPAASFAPRYSQAPEARIPGIAKTSVDHRYDEGVIGSLGFLCGLEQGAERKGSAAIRGYDQTGRFVGAKLRVAFR